jgi:hypothetical protein
MFLLTAARAQTGKGAIPGRSLVSLLLVLLGVQILLAQVDRAALEGTVTDQTGAILVGARVQVVAVDTGISQEQLTNAEGYYWLPGLAIGHYTASVASAGFKTMVFNDVVLEVGQTRTLNVRLNVGAAAEKVEVTASSQLSDLTSVQPPFIIRTDQIAYLPSNGRDWASLTMLAPFAQDDGGGDQRTIRFAGRARDDNNFMFDGVDAGGIQEQAQKSQTRLQISQDAIEEYSVNPVLYNAEYGTQSGGQINVVTKSGTNNFHGTVFSYFRNSVFDARNFNDFDINGNPAIPPFRFGQYGMTFGGPIVKNKLFFFTNYEGLRQYSATTNQLLVPSPSIVRTTLSQSPQMCSILQAFPWRASTGSIGNCNPIHVYPDGAFADQTSQGLPDSDLFTSPSPTTAHEDTWLVRMDYSITAKTTLYGRAQRDISLVSGTNGSNALPYDLIQTNNHPANYFVALSHIFSPNLLNEAKVYINRAPFINPQVGPLDYAVHSNNWVTINNINADHEVGTTYGVIDNLTWIHGRHTLKTGIEIRRVRLNQGKTADNNLDFSDSSGTADTAFASATLYKLSYTSPWCCHKYRRTFYLPYVQDEWKVTPNLTLSLGLRYEYYGVAHEADNRTTVFDLNQFHGVCLGSGSSNGPVLTPINTPPCPKNPSLYNPDYTNFDPRVGLAWSPGSWNGKGVIRAGFGIYTGAAQNDDLNAGLESDRSTAFVNLDPGGPGTPLLPAYQQEIPDLSPLGTNVATLQQPRALQRQGRRNLYAESWGLTIEHELAWNTVVSLQYVGTRGVHLFSRGGVNFCISKPNPVTGVCTRALDPYYPDPTGQSPTLDPYGSVDYKSDIGASTYNALLVRAERHLKNGLAFQANYTWSHSINDGSVGGGESNGPENVNCLACDKGPSVFDVRHNIAVNALYQLPFGKGKSYLNGGGTLDKIVGGWSLSGIGLWHTGHPLTITMNISPTQLPDGNDQTTQRPDLVPGVPLLLPGGVQNYTLPINPAAFAPPPLDPAGADFNPATGLCTSTCGLLSRFGNAPNGLIRAPNYWQIDLSLVKETKITERISVEFGAQFFNIFNHVQLGDPNTGNLAFNYVQATDANGNLIPNKWTLQPAGALGRITTTVNFNNNNDNAASPNTGTGLPRQIQFMFRVRF